MPKANLLDELEAAEAALTQLSQAVERKIRSSEIKEDYYGLIQQACVALNKIRACVELNDWFDNGGLKTILEKLEDKAGGR